MVLKPLPVNSVDAKEIAPWISPRCHTWCKRTNSTRQSKMRSWTIMTSRPNHSALPKSWPTHERKHIPKERNTSFMHKKRQNQPKPMRRSKAHVTIHLCPLPSQELRWTHHRWLMPSQEQKWTHQQWLLVSQEQKLTRREEVGPILEPMGKLTLVQGLKQMLRDINLISQVSHPQRNNLFQSFLLSNSKEQSSSMIPITVATMIPWMFMRAKKQLSQMVKMRSMMTIFEPGKRDYSS